MTPRGILKFFSLATLPYTYIPRAPTKLVCWLFLKNILWNCCLYSSSGIFLCPLICGKLTLFSRFKWVLLLLYLIKSFFPNSLTQKQNRTEQLAPCFRLLQCSFCAILTNLAQAVVLCADDLMFSWFPERHPLHKEHV